LVPPYGRERVRRVGPRGCEIPPRLVEPLPRERQPPRRLERGHPARQRRRIVPRQVVQVPFEVRADAYVHARGYRLAYVLPVVLPPAEETVQDVVLVRCDYEVAHGQPHALGVVTGEDVAEVARRDREVHLRNVPLKVGNAEVTPEVVGGLRKHATPVDAVHGAEVHSVPEGRVVEARLDDVLAVVEGPVHHGDAVDVVVGDGGHLALLYLADASVREEDDAVDAALAAEAVYGGRAGVAGGGAEHRETAVVGAGGEEILEEITEHLEGHVLEGEGRTVK